MDRPYAIAATPPRKLWGLGRVDVVLATKCLASFFSECATLAASTYALSLAARVPGANRARTYGALLSLFDAGRRSRSRRSTSAFKRTKRNTSYTPRRHAF